MDLLETVNARCREIGLEDDAHARTTVRAPDVTTPSPSATLVSGGTGSTARELPRISVDLRGTLSGADTPAAQGAPVRDLEVLRTLGEGGMGRVFLARQHSLDRDVAIKTLRDRASDRERHALVGEGAITGYLEHPAIVPVHALGVDDHGRPVLVMKRVVGEEWADRLRDHPADLDDHLAVLVQVCHAIEFAHSKRVLHRDIKPANVLVGAFGEVQLCDFGIALRLEADLDRLPMSGTPAYMAPEMVVGGALDERTDVYLLGATLHHVLCGEPRHLRPTVRETLLAAAESKPFAYSAGTPRHLAELANAATAKDPAQRPGSAAAFRQGLQEHLRHKSSVALAASAIERVAALRDQDPRRQDVEIEVLGAEARLALRHALDEWPENAAAVAALAELDALMAARRSRLAELERLAHELDPGVSRAQRARIAAAMSLLALVLGALGVARGAAVTARGLLLESLLPLAFGVALVAAFRRNLRTTINRRGVFMLLVVLATLPVHRALAHGMGLSVPTILTQDLLLVSVVVVLAGALLEGRTLVVLLATAPATVVAALAPVHAVLAFSLASSCGLLLGTWATLGARRERALPPASRRTMSEG